MNKTIINGIDVSECIHLDEWKHCNICKELIKTIPDRHQCVTEQDLRCEYYSNCYFKQLKRLEQQIETYQLSENEAKEIIAEVNYKNKKLREENNILKQAIKNKNFVAIVEENEKLQKEIYATRYSRLEMYESFETECNKYKQALEEIRSYCDEQNLKADYTACYITNRIDEVLNDRD